MLSGKLCKRLGKLLPCRVCFALSLPACGRAALSSVNLVAELQGWGRPIGLVPEVESRAQNLNPRKRKGGFHDLSRSNCYLAYVSSDNYRVV